MSEIISCLDRFDFQTMSIQSAIKSLFSQHLYRLLNLTYDLLLKNTRLSATPVMSICHTYFVICNSCYWCASYFGIDDLKSQIINCHVCNSSDTGLMPIGPDESFRIECNQSRRANHTED